MIKASSRRKRFPIRVSLLLAVASFPREMIAFLDAPPTAILFDGIQRLAHPRYRPLIACFGGSLAVSIMWDWDWQLVLATGLGIGGMSLVYLLPQQQWRWQQWRLLLQGLSGKMLLAAGVGGTTAVSTYVMTAIWAESNNRWLAIASIFQSLGTAGILGLVSWQLAIAHQSRQSNSYEQWLIDLTASEPLKRLMAVRQLSQLKEQQALNEAQFQQLLEYFSLMLTQENEPTIRQALFEDLQSWQRSSPPASLRQPLKIPLNSEKTMVRRPLLD